MNPDIQLNSQNLSLPESLKTAVETIVNDWQTNDKIGRLWRQDQTIWTNDDEAKWLGWLDIVQEQLDDKQKFADFAREVQTAGFTHVLLMGMGGSSLCPEVLSLTYGRQNGFPEFHVLDSTSPTQIKALETKLDLAKTLFFVSSKSGSTLEPNIFKQYFFERVAEIVGRENAGKQFVAITDPNSKMQKVAEGDGFRRIFYGLPSIGGRFSALSDFGMIPAAAMGLDVDLFLNRTAAMVAACQSEDARENPGVMLGAVLGAANLAGRDKLTILTSPAIFDLGAWLEQLIAESTGKTGKSIIPVDREEIQKAADYSDDRLFVYLKLEGDDARDDAAAALEQANQPVIEIILSDKYNLGQEFFRWEIATAVAGSIMEINTFNQPDVEAAKIETRKLTDEYEQAGHLPEEKSFYEGEGVKLFTDDKNTDALNAIVGDEKTLQSYLKAHLSRLEKSDYFALLAFIEMNAETETALQKVRDEVLQNHKVATCLGFGPRFLHSTGQAYKGGANSGVFLQITCDYTDDLPVPDQKYTFGTVQSAQARGDFQVLVDRDRRALRVHLGANVGEGLKSLHNALLNSQI